VFRAFLAWHDGTLGDWNVTTGDFRKVADDKFNLAVALRGDRLVTSSVRGNTGRVQEWKVGADLAKGAAKEYAPNQTKIDMPLAPAFPIMRSASSRSRASGRRRPRSRCSRASARRCASSAS